MTTKPEPVPFEHHHVREESFGEDHFLALDYIRTVISECSGFQVGFDPLMRSNQINFHTLRNACPFPKRTGYRPTKVQVMHRLESTVLKSGKILPDHDDWMCLLNMAEAGYFSHSPQEIEPGVTIILSGRGREVTQALFRHIRMGGKIKDFKVPSSDRILCA